MGKGCFLREGGALHPAHLSVHLSAMGNSLLNLRPLTFELPVGWNFPRGPIGPLAQ